MSHWETWAQDQLAAVRRDGRWQFLKRVLGSGPPPAATQ